ncbi:MAG: hypothetical protein ACYC0Q_16145, partial [Eubacteriales bacterium]
MTSEIFTSPVLISHPPVPRNFNNDIKGWLTEKAGEYSLRWLLAHADDGVIWGELRGKKLLLSITVFPENSP